MKRIFIFFTLTFIKLVIAQDKQSYEKIAYDYFEKNIISKDYSNIKYFEYDGKINFEWNGYSTCMQCKSLDTVKTKIYTISLNNNKNIKRRITFFDRLFIPKSKLRKIYVFKRYRYFDSIVVCINVSEEQQDHFYTFQISESDKEVKEYCKTIMYN
ncbi:hypothetical protein [Flavobacterium sp. 3HN19-14]|uniref:hypothetical protein n=1 Tax=Flavobacterium sp. 3HN19-14 TaxID=3448133 RepID=UPI003EE00F75